ncbi:MAG: glutamine--fructose-6-phosphate transaminase (isomerizing), partial [Chlamydiae bacterium]|nr:glutamine--fructose-6-phosphate transaminase (isomerizing) [Chlamydiota bacterium]
MCGISGYLGKNRALPLVMEGISWLEYRGYDSAGVAAVSPSKLYVEKCVGKVGNLEAKLQKSNAHLAIAHTRWATHGEPTFENAHPHTDSDLEVAIVHNGIIENHEKVRHFLQSKGVKLCSQTDSEVIAQLIAHLYDGSLLEAVQGALANLEGAFALAVVHKRHPDQLIAAAKESPLAVGIAPDGIFVSSDARSFGKYTKKVFYLQEAEVASISEGSVQVYDATSKPIDKQIEELAIEDESSGKGEYGHYMHKEIHEQVQTIQNALLSRYSLENGTATLDALHSIDLTGVERVVVLACGSSYHAGLIGSFMLEEMARLPTEVEISSEYRYRNPVVHPNTLVLAISQSGETADTLAAMRELREKGAKIIGICNVQGSTLAREVDSCLFLRAGPEIGVAASKTLTSQLVVLALLTLRFARMRQMSQQEGL